MHTKRLLSLLQQSFATEHRDWTAIRPKGIISVNAVPIIEVVPQGFHEPSRIYWHPETSRYINDDERQKIIDQFCEATTFNTEVDTSTWSCS
jgi:hypothetical protein